MPAEAAVIGIDLGSRKTGLAVAVRGIPLPRGIVPTRDALAAIRKIAEESRADAAVLGMPDECYRQRRAATDKFLRALRAALPGVRVETMDEGMTTFEADSDATENPGYEPFAEPRDDAAAMAILRRWLAGKK